LLRPNKATVEVKELARLHGPAAIKEAVHIMKTSESDQARLAAAREILDRAYGKPQQAIVAADDGALTAAMMSTVNTASAR